MLRTFSQRRLSTATVLVGLVCGPAAWAQLATFQEITSELSRAGFGIYDFSIFGSYSNTRTPSVSSTGDLIPDYSFHTYSTGASTSLGWRSKNGSKFHFNVRLSAAYDYEISSTGFVGHAFTPRDAFNGSWSGPISARWTLSAGIAGAVGNFNQLLLNPNGEQVLTATPGTASDFTQTLVTGTSSNTDLVTAATSPQALVEGQANLLYGGFLLTTTGNVSANYAATPRTQLGFSVSGGRSQSLPDPFESENYTGVRETTSLSGSARISYKLGARTNSYASVSYARAVSSLYASPSASFMAGVSRTLTPHWAASASLGMGYILPAHNGANVQGFQRTGYQATVSTGYRLLRNSFMGSASRVVGDNFGLGATSTLTARAGWGWHPLRGQWGLSAGASMVRLEGTPVANRGYSFNASIRESFNKRTFAALSLGYGEGSGLIGLGGLAQPHTRSETVAISMGFRPYLGTPDVSRIGGP